MNYENIISNTIYNRDSLFLGFQLLYPLGLEKYYTYSVIIAAIVNFISNYLMIPKYLQNGAAIGTVTAETIGSLIMLFFARKHLKKIDFFPKKRLKYFVATILMCVVIIFIKKFEISPIKNIIFSFIFGGIIYISILLFLKEEICTEGLKIIKSRI
ncbi:polysaccharide biosynthesis C-terminal domain-containing protein [Fusobacterium nucleatum]|uniref:polysaccharide biosynthesis C-terminal domain-containing protein n=1 Tax=Fusobacterium nucleatum TaxID=851 RepID=UPI003D01D8D3